MGDAEWINWDGWIESLSGIARMGGMSNAEVK